MTFSEDVEQILREHGRAETGDVVTEIGAGGEVFHVVQQDDPRPTRQQIIQDAVRLWAKRERLHLNDAPEQYRKGDLEKFFGCCPEMQTEDEAALRRGDGQIVDEQSIEAKVAHFIKVAGPAFEGVDLKTYMDEVRER